MIKIIINYVNDQPICEEIFEYENTFIDDYTIINNSIVLNVNRCQQFYYIK